MPLSQIRESEGATCHSTEGSGGYLVKQVREKQTLCPLYVESEKLTSESKKESEEGRLQDGVGSKRLKLLCVE